MNFKKILASVAASAVAVSALSVASFASVEDPFEGPSGPISDVELAAWGSQWVQSYDEELLAVDFADYEVVIKATSSGEYDDDNSVAVQVYQLSGQADDYVIQFPGEAGDTDIEVAFDLDELGLNAYNGINFQIQAGHLPIVLNSVTVRAKDAGAAGEAEPVEIALSGSGVITNEGGGVRLTVFNPWGDPDTMKLIDWAEVEGTEVVSVMFQVTGVETPFNAYLTISNFDDVNYWDPSDANPAITISEDGIYVVTVELAGPYTVGGDNFLAVQTDLEPAADDPDLENVPEFALLAVAKDAALTADDDEEVPPTSTPEETTEPNVTDPDTTTAGEDVTTAPAATTPDNSTNPGTGVVLAVIPAIAAAAGVIVSRKRK